VDSISIDITLTVMEGGGEEVGGGSPLVTRVGGSMTGQAGRLSAHPRVGQELELAVLSRRSTIGRNGQSGPVSPVITVTSESAEENGP